MSLLMVFSWMILSYVDEVNVKQFLARHEALGSLVHRASLTELIHAEVERLGFEGVRIVAVGPRPVWSVTASLGASVYDCDYIVRVAVKRLAQNLGFELDMRDILARVRGECVQAVFCLDQPL